MAQIQLARIVTMSDPRSVLAAAEGIVRLMEPEFDAAPLRKVFFDVRDLFEGHYPGYRACNTGYHDLQHTTDVFLATARLLHGATLAGHRFSPCGLTRGLWAALFHDVGYIQTLDDVEGTGAKYTADHVERGAAFAQTYLPANGGTEKDAAAVRAMLLCTDLAVPVGEIPFPGREEEEIGKILGTADLVGQMANRTYLEKLLYLYREFKEGEVEGFVSEFDLLAKTVDFYRFVQERLKQDLGDMARHMRRHFQARWRMDEDPYTDGIEKQMEFLKNIVSNHAEDYREFLKRDGLIDKLDAFYGRPG